jgi:hypothetical protein
MASSPNGHAFALPSPDGTDPLPSDNQLDRVFLWDAAGPSTIAAFDGSTPVQFSPDGGKLLVTASVGFAQEPRLLDAATGRVLATFRGKWEVFPPAAESERASSWRAAVEPTSSKAGNQGWARALFITSASSQERLATLRLLGGGLSGAVVTPDGYLELVGESARSAVSCRVGPFSFPIEACEERLVVPGLLAKILAGDTSYRDP